MFDDSNDSMFPSLTISYNDAFVVSFVVSLQQIQPMAGNFSVLAPLSAAGTPGPWPSNPSNIRRHPEGWTFSTVAGTDLGSRRPALRIEMWSLCEANVKPRLWVSVSWWKKRDHAGLPPQVCGQEIWDMASEARIQGLPWWNSWDMMIWYDIMGCLSQVIPDVIPKNVQLFVPLSLPRPSLGPKMRIWSDPVLDPFLETCGLLRLASWLELSGQALVPTFSIWQIYSCIFSIYLLNVCWFIYLLNYSNNVCNLSIYAYLLFDSFSFGYLCCSIYLCLYLLLLYFHIVCHRPETFSLTNA